MAPVDFSFHGEDVESNRERVVASRRKQEVYALKEKPDLKYKSPKVMPTQSWSYSIVKEQTDEGNTDWCFWFVQTHKFLCWETRRFSSLS